MENYYKHSLVACAISLCCSITFLNADLLNGPYSPESQKIVQLVENPNLVIPDDLKKYENQIKSLRIQFDPNSKLGFMATSAKWLKDKYLVEVVIQLLLKLKPESKFYPGYNKNEYYKVQIATIALIIKDFGLLKQLWGNLPQQVKNEFFETTYMVMPLEQLQEFNDDMERLRNLIELGMDVNAIDTERKTTPLDQLGNGITSGFYTKVNQAQTVIDFLKSKGAKTYAELTAAEKGQK